MPFIKYQDINLRGDTVARIRQANEIIREYQEQGFDLTLRQLYYQHVARGLIDNNDREYKRLGDLISNGRLAGLVDWSAIVDRGRNVSKRSHWDSPSEIVEAIAEQYTKNLWVGQDVRPEVWVEKEALAGVLEGVCKENDLPLFPCKGYVSSSEMWSAARRLRGYIRDGQRPLILHMGDHDPSGLDMTRDIRDRIALFFATDLDIIPRIIGADNEEGPTKEEMADAIYEANEEFDVRRIALNRDQIEEFDPPPNPVKTTDGRWRAYVAQTGFDQSWELDALDPTTLARLITEQLDDIRDEAAWERATSRENYEKAQLQEVADQWGTVREYLANQGDEDH